MQSLTGEKNRIGTGIKEFQGRLETLEGFVISRAADYSELPEKFAQVHKHWSDNISPALLSIQGKTSTITVAQLEQEIPIFVQEIDDIVFLLEQDLEQKIALLRSLQIALLVMTLAVCLVTMWLMKNQVVRPLKDLLQAASRVRDKDFSAKAQHTDLDELGQLGVAFNMMVAEIATTYDNQNQLIAERTRELTESNRSLELMYQSALQLSDQSITPSTLKALLDVIESELGLSSGTVCINEHGTFLRTV